MSGVRSEYFVNLDGVQAFLVYFLGAVCRPDLFDG